MVHHTQLRDINHAIHFEDEVGPLPHRPMIPPLTPSPHETPDVAPPQPRIYLPMKQTWEYKVVVQSPSDATALTEADLNALGAEGWELAGVLPSGESTHFYFKRLQ